MDEFQLTICQNYHWISTVVLSHNTYLYLSDKTRITGFIIADVLSKLIG